MRLIRIMRAFFRVTRNELATRAGISSRELTRIEAGDVSPTPRTMQELDKGMTMILEDRLSKALHERQS